MDADARLLEQIAWDTNRRGSAHELFHRAMSWICEHTGYELGHACFIRSGEREDTIPVGIWYGAEHPRFTRFRQRSDSMIVACGEDLLGHVIDARVPVQIYDVTAEPAYRRRLEALEAGIHGAFAIPVLVGDEALAAVEFYSSRARLLGEDAVGTVAAAGVILGRAVEHDHAILEYNKRDAQLQQAEKIANLGTWEWAIATGEVRWSRQLFRIYGVDAPSFEGTFESHLQHIAAGEDDRVRAILEAAVRAQQPFEFEARSTVAGKPRYLLTRGEVLLDSRGEPVRLVGVCQDVTLIREARERETRLALEQAARQYAEHKAGELERLTRELERSNQELHQFAYVASHDLKAPLRGIANLSEWLEEDLGDKLTSESRKHLELLRGRVHRLEALIDGLLAYSRVGRARGVPEAVDVRALIDEVLELLAPPEDVELHIEPGMPILITQRIPLQQVFHNLLGNALKHGSCARPCIRVGVRDAGVFYEFHVTDNGAGIPRKYQDRIWQIFQTLQPRDKVEGTGIGLALVKKIVERQGGVAGVESEPGAGARFYFRWPKEEKESHPDGA